MDVVDTAEQLTAFAALARTADEAPENSLVSAEGDEVCERCKRGLVTYVRVPDLDFPGQHALWCGPCAARKGLL